MSENKEFRELIFLINQIELHNRHQHINQHTDTDDINGIEMRQRQQAGLNPNPDLVDVLEVPDKGVKRLNRHINEHKHAQNVENPIEGDDLCVVEEGPLDAYAAVVHHAEGEDVP